VIGDVRYWHLADIPTKPLNVRFTPKSGHHLGLGSNSIPVRAYGMLGPRASPELLPWLNLKLLSLREA
jgi:hypothetical protein